MKPARLLSLVAVGVISLAVNGLAEEERAPAADRVQAVVYEIFHGDSLHRMGTYVREVHVPSRSFAFHVANGELRVFRPQQLRYALPGETLELPSSTGKPLELPVLHLPGTEPRRKGTITMPAAHVDALEGLLDETTRLRAVADSYLLPPGELVPVAAHLTMNEAVARFLGRLLDDAGILTMGTGGAGGETWSVPKARASEARRLLRKALLDGLADPPVDPYVNPSWDAHLEYSILGADGTPEWYGDRTKILPAPAGVDVVAHLARFPGSDTVEKDGKRRVPKYGDLDVERSELALHGHRPRPWTVERLKTWYAETPAEDEEIRGALLYLLAASRDHDSVAVLGKALGDEHLTIRVAATYAILKYWCEEPMVGGGTESAMQQAEEWWKARQSRGTPRR